MTGLENLVKEAEVKPAAKAAASPPTAPEPEEDIPPYAPRRKIYPQSVAGTYRRIKWALLIATLGIYYFLPFVRWDRGPNAPGQAVLVDFPNRRFYFFFIEIWPQEVYYLTGLLILAATTLFLITSLAGRVWCGYTCPQTVWTDLFVAVERLIEVYLERRESDEERFIDVVRRTGIEPFKERIYDDSHQTAKDRRRRLAAAAG